MCKEKRAIQRMTLNGIRRRPTLPGRFQPSTISVLRLNFCVRYGNRWIPQAIITGNCIHFMPSPFFKGGRRFSVRHYSHPSRFSAQPALASGFPTLRLALFPSSSFPSFALPQLPLSIPPRSCAFRTRWTAVRFFLKVPSASCFILPSLALRFPSALRFVLPSGFA